MKLKSNYTLKENFYNFFLSHVAIFLQTDPFYDALTLYYIRWDHTNYKGIKPIMSDFIEKLHSYHLFTLQSRIYNKLLIFAYSIKTYGRAPFELSSHIDLLTPEDDQENQNIYGEIP